VQHFSSVEPLLFKKVIDQFIGVGENTAAATPAGAAGGAQVSQE
jgi:cytochrome o ubiquinol oxidase subunit 2